MALELKRYLFTRAEYHRLAEAGVLGEDDRVELIEGEILEMSPIGRRQWACVDRLSHLFVRAVGNEAIVHVQNPVPLNERSEPEPDLTLLRFRADFYAPADPTPADVLLVVEVASSSVADDRDIKAPLYARARIDELWLVDLVANRLAVYRDPSPTGYRTIRVCGRGEQVSPLFAPDVMIDVDAILGPADQSPEGAGDL